MQRRNFRMPGREIQRSNFRSLPPRLDLNRDLDHWVRGLRSVKETREKIAAREADPRPRPDDVGRWQDDGGEGG